MPAWWPRSPNRRADDHAGVLGRRDEIGGHHRATGVLAPADQGLDAGNAAQAGWPGPQASHPSENIQPGKPGAARMRVIQ